MALANKKIYKVAGLSLLGFCAVSFGMDKANVGPLVSQLASFSGAFVGALVGARKRRALNTTPEVEAPEPQQQTTPAEPSQVTDEQDEQQTQVL